MKTVRFATVVLRAGKPEHHLTWSAPADDPVLKRAQQKHLLLTVHQHTRGAIKDYGVVGLEPGRNAQYFVFPRSLRSFAGTRVVAINYELVDERLSQAETLPARKAKSSRARENVIPFPKSERTPPQSVPVAPPPKKLEQPLPPLTLPEIKRAVAGALRDLHNRKTDSAEERLAALVKRLPP